VRTSLILALVLSALSCSSSDDATTPAPDAAAPPKVGDLEAFAEVQSTEGIAFANDKLYVSASGALHRIAANGAVEQRIDVPGALGIAARPDGQLLVCGKDGDAGVIWKVATDGTKSVLVGGMKQPNFVAIAPDDSIVFSDSAADRVYRAGADGSAPTVITDTIVYPNGVAFAKDGMSVYVASWKTKKVFSMARKADGTYDAPVVLVDGVENVDGLVVGASGDLYLVANGLGIVRVRAGKTESLTPKGSFQLAANAAFAPASFGEGWLYVTNLIGPAVSRLYVGESGAALPSR
jgi:sugar lactone lactonase YvrE